jgi:hypothetical protein
MCVCSAAIACSLGVANCPSRGEARGKLEIAYRRCITIDIAKARGVDFCKAPGAAPCTPMAFAGS